jgi:2-polyprenyl-3-methyl-5-hydroxy-6-metoxy-1,4-benzoquinol methylase
VLSWPDRVHQWSHLPVDDVGYESSLDLMKLSDNELRDLVNKMRKTRYGGWRNYRGLWRSTMGLDSTTDKDIIDFGCGVGIEALELALAGNRVSLADLSLTNLWVAQRVLRLFDCEPAAMLQVFDQPPYFDYSPASTDVFYCNGVLHHIPWARSIMEAAHDALRPGGEARLMVYSDVGWRRATNTPPPVDVTTHPKFETFVRYFDAVGDYSDWYNSSKLESKFGDLFNISKFTYLTESKIYLSAVLNRRSI